MINTLHNDLFFRKIAIERRFVNSFDCHPKVRVLFTVRKECSTKNVSANYFSLAIDLIVISQLRNTLLLASDASLNSGGALDLDFGKIG